MMSTVSIVSTMSTRVSRHCYQASTNQLLNHYDVYNIYSLYSLYKDFQGLLMYIWRSREMHVDPINSAQVVRVMHLGVHIPMGAHMCLCPTSSMQMVNRRVHIYS